MSRRDTEAIGDAIRVFLRSEGLETPYNQYRLISAWPAVMGNTIAKYTSEIYIKNQTLYVRLTSPALRNDLNMQRKNIVNKLNKHINALVISDIMFI